MGDGGPVPERGDGSQTYLRRVPGVEEWNRVIPAGGEGAHSHRADRDVWFLCREGGQIQRAVAVIDQGRQTGGPGALIVMAELFAQEVAPRLVGGQLPGGRLAQRAVGAQEGLPRVARPVPPNRLARPDVPDGPAVVQCVIAQDPVADEQRAVRGDR